MASHFETLAQAKKEFKRRTGVDYRRTERHHSGLGIYNRNRCEKWRKNKLKKPYYVGSYMQWLNL